MKFITQHLIVGLAVFSIFTSWAFADQETPAKKLGWKLGVQAYTFRALTFFETVDKVHELGLKYIEMYPGQLLKPGSKTKTGVNMSAAELTKLQAKLKAADVNLTSFGVAPIHKANEAVAAQKLIAITTQETEA